MKRISAVPANRHGVAVGAAHNQGPDHARIETDGAMENEAEAALVRLRLHFGAVEEVARTSKVATGKRAA